MQAVRRANDDVLLAATDLSRNALRWPKSRRLPFRVVGKDGVASSAVRRRQASPTSTRAGGVDWVDGRVKLTGCVGLARQMAGRSGADKGGCRGVVGHSRGLCDEPACRILPGGGRAAPDCRRPEGIRQGRWSRAERAHPAAHRREVVVAAALPDEAPVSRLLWSHDEGEGGWVVLLFEDIEGRNPTVPWRDI